MSSKSAHNQQPWKPKGHRLLNAAGRAPIKESERELKARASIRRAKANKIAKGEVVEPNPVSTETGAILEVGPAESPAASS